MKMKKQYLTFIFVFLLLLIGTTISYGAYNASSSKVQSEGKITVKVTSTEALDAYNLDLKDNGGLTFNNCTKAENGAIININKSSIGYMNMSGSTKELGTYTFTAPKVTEEKKYTITFLIDKKTTVKSTITVTPVVDTTNDSKKPVETPKEPEKPVQTQKEPEKIVETTTPTTNPAPTPQPVVKSSEARLSNFGIRPNDFTGFKRDKYEYSTTVPNDVEKVTIYADVIKDSNATIKGTGDVSLKEGDNTFEVKVTAEDGKTTKTYKLTIERQTAAEAAEQNAEARLKSLAIKPKEYDFSGFDSEKTSYSVEVPNEVKEIEIEAKAMNSEAQITGTGMIELEEGLNELKIEVIAVDGTKKAYTLEVTRKQEDKVVAKTEEKLGLGTLKIDGLNLNQSFKTGKYEYTVDLKEDISSLEIQAIANNEDATVEIVGNENLKEGENVITILVENIETKEVSTYQIIVNKNLTQEEIVTMSWLKPDTWGKEEFIKILIIIVLLILIVCAILLKMKIAKEENKKQKVDFPGAEELDKAIAEHQELTAEEMINEEEKNYIEDIPQEKVTSNYIEDIAKNKDFFREDEMDFIPKKRGKHF